MLAMLAQTAVKVSLCRACLVMRKRKGACCARRTSYLDIFGPIMAVLYFSHTHFLVWNIAVLFLN